MKILFVCHGSICRSPAAEMIFKSLNNEHEVISRALTHEEIGNDIYPPMKKELIRRGIPFTPHHATYISLDDFESSDYVFYMDVENHYMLVRRFGDDKKILPVFKFSKDITEIEDPWWTGNYKKVVDQLTTCIKDILQNI
jgi:protein-tyrosine phosphatase